MASYPFTAIFEQEEMKLGLVLSVIDPRIGGVLIMGHRGTAKTTAVRALAEVLPPQKRVRGCTYGCDPDDQPSLCSDCSVRLEKGKRLTTERSPIRVVELPLGATEDRVCGSLDIERALHGTQAFAPGLLARAHRGFLYIDEVNLLEDHLVDLLLDVAASGRNVVEREGLSLQHPARFVLIGSANPEEGDLRPQLQDRFGLYVRVETIADAARRTEIIRRCEQFDRDAAAFHRAMAPGQARLRRRIVRARGSLPRVEASDEIVAAMASLCVRLEIVGHRGELTLLRAAKALAAFDGRLQVTPDDVRRVAVMALGHRLRRDVHGDMDSGVRIRHALDDPERERRRSSGAGAEDVVLPAAPAPLLRDICEVTEPGRSGQPPGKAYGPTMAARHKAQRVDWGATIRAAVPLQRLRPQAGAAQGIRIHEDDIRFRRHRPEARVLIMFVIDTSGSMAVNRIREAKGAVVRLLGEAYTRRHKVAVIAFRRGGAEVVLPPTRSSERARRALDGLAVGGATPLAAGIAAALEMARRVRRVEGREPRLVLLTDAGANTVAGRNGGDVWTELRRFCGRLRDESISSVLIDTRQPFLSRGAGEKLASLMGARYISLPRPDADSVYRAITSG